MTPSRTLDREEIAAELFKQGGHPYGWDDLDSPVSRSRYLRQADWVIEHREDYAEQEKKKCLNQ